MTDTNASTLRSALAAAVKKHVEDAGLTHKQAAIEAKVQYSRLCQVMRGEVSKISSDALVNMLGELGYRLTDAAYSNGGTDIVLSLDKVEFPDDPGEPMYTKAAEAGSGEFDPDHMNSNDLVDNPDSFYVDSDCE